MLKLARSHDLVDWQSFTFGLSTFGCLFLCLSLFNRSLNNSPVLVCGHQKFTKNSLWTAGKVIMLLAFKIWVPAVQKLLETSQAQVKLQTLIYF